MITACELCTKITVENVMREEAERVAKMKVAKTFAEEIISPILENLTEIPDHLCIGYRYHGSSAIALFTKISDWQKSMTNRGNPKWDRNLSGMIRGSIDFSLLDYEVLNQYLAEFGFQISYETEWMKMTRYSTSTADTSLKVDTLYLSMTCPIENC